MNFLGGHHPDSDTVDLNNDTINFLLEIEQDTQTIQGKSYTWIKCNRDFQGFYVTEYSFPWSRFSTVLEFRPTVNEKKKYSVILNNSLYFIVLFR